jgi:hypothetical protein
VLLTALTLHVEGYPHSKYKGLVWLKKIKDAAAVEKNILMQICVIIVTINREYMMMVVMEIIQSVIAEILNGRMLILVKSVGINQNSWAD